jgi:hypothetical protein
VQNVTVTTTLRAQDVRRLDLVGGARSHAGK